MAIATNIDVAVEEAAFSAFYTQYTADLEKNPEAWAKVARSAQVAQSKFAAVSDAAASHAETLDHVVERTTTLRRVTDATLLAWKELARNTATAAYNINNATSSLLKWAGVRALSAGFLASVV